ncbi:TIGR04283 family arsenosugar biosynthesis glycosyltransferase [Bermanella sp. R86510]|uniref:TIGR04283 family arsenosugar biosynthesis glycosyltransferase n=1 Tax=unclassified Bermanella TaxID=2627862 RepID=UPI0037C9318E
MSSLNVSIIVPVYNEAEQVHKLIRRLRVLKGDITDDIIIVDGGSSDDTDARLSKEFKVISSPKGRSLQMNAGAAHAKGTWLFFLHADTHIGPSHIQTAILDAGRRSWGRFDVCFDDKRWPFKMIAWFMNMRSRLTGVATGDQCLFVRKKYFDQVGGFAPIALMEDIELCKRLKQKAKPVCLHKKVTTSARRWQHYGIWRTIFLMWKLRFFYWFGVKPDVLEKLYRAPK